MTKSGAASEVYLRLSRGITQSDTHLSRKVDRHLHTACSFHQQRKLSRLDPRQQAECNEVIGDWINPQASISIFVTRRIRFASLPNVTRRSGPLYREQILHFEERDSRYRTGHSAPQWQDLGPSMPLVVDRVLAYFSMTITASHLAIRLTHRAFRMLACFRHRCHHDIDNLPRAIAVLDFRSRCPTWHERG